ncbi:MAG: GHKL domain-containing protein [Firmicutes bacterium]|nr:GHKL domain-containing protein [Bacillota bacterium]
MGVLIALMGILPLLAVMHIGFRYIERIEDENRMLQENMEAVRIYSESLAERMKRIRHFHHDAAGLVQALELETEIAAQPEDPLGSMPLLRSVLELKKRQFSEAGVSYCCELQIPKPEELPGEDELCQVLQNLLENALEASLRIGDPAGRRVCLRVEQQEGARGSSGDGPACGGDSPCCGGDSSCCGGDSPGEAPVRISVTNAVDPRERITFRSRKSGADEHGMGLRIVDEVTSRRGGSREVIRDPQEHTLTMTVML